MTRKVPNIAVDFVSKHEGCKLTAYPDPATGGDPWTIGWGHTGPEVHRGLKITKNQALDYLAEDLKTAAGRISARIGSVVEELSDHQYAALLSFVFNLGANPSWTIWKVLKARQFDQVPPQMLRFVNANGRRMQGLVNRRTAEVAMWSTADYDDEPALPSSVTRRIETPPTPTDTKPLMQSKSFVTAAASTITAVGVGAGEASRAISPYAERSELISRALSTLAIVGAVAAALTLLFVWLKKARNT